jgi:hypothetical protein
MSCAWWRCATSGHSSRVTPSSCCRWRSATCSPRRHSSISDSKSAAAGVYLEAVNAGFITYLAVRPDVRNQQLGRKLRAHLLECFHEDARRNHGAQLAWTVGEVRRESAWLRTLVQGGRAITFDFGYFHPWMPLRAEGRYVLYREPAADTRAEIPAGEVARLLFAIWRRAYRIRYPLQSETFCYMLRGLEGRGMIGPDPGFASTDGDAPGGS